MNKIKRQRENLDYSQKEVAEMLGVKIPQYQRYESGKTVPNVFIAQKIARVLNINLDTFAKWLKELNK